MKIIVCVKQVPDTADIKWTENNTLNRDGVESVINPCDLFATETALRIKDRQCADITAISMGPKQAESALREVISMGVDEACLLSDRYFAASDTAATARVLAKAIQEKRSDFDLIICGQYASDGDTAQTGPSLAQNLGISLVTNVKSIEKIENDKIIVFKQEEDFVSRIEAKLPAVICILTGKYLVRMPKISGRMKAQDAKIPIYTAEDINFDAAYSGLKGSPTYVKKAFRPKGRSDGEILYDNSAVQSAELLLDKIKEFKG